MKAHLELTGGVLRLYRNDAAGDRDPPDYCVMVVGHERLAIIKGLVTTPGRPLPAGMWDAVRRELRAAGFREVLWTRYDGEGRKVREVRKSL